MFQLFLSFDHVSLEPGLWPIASYQAGSEPASFHSPCSQAASTRSLQGLYKEKTMVDVICLVDFSFIDRINTSFNIFRISNFGDMHFKTFLFLRISYMYKIKYDHISPNDHNSSYVSLNISLSQLLVFFFINPLSPGSAVHICKRVGIYWSVGLLPTACIFSFLIFLYSWVVFHCVNAL